MSVVFACIAPHSGHLLIEKHEPTPIPKSRAAMAEMHRLFQAARPESIALLTPHGLRVEGAISLGVTPRVYGDQDGIIVDAPTDMDLAAAWAYRGTERGVPVAPIVADREGGPLPLDWGATIPLSLLAPDAPPVVVGCPDPSLSNDQLVAWGEALVQAAEEVKTRVALIVSADQGHGHAADGPYGFAPASARYDQMMTDAVQADDLPRLLTWEENFAEEALADSYWQTLALIGVQKHIPLRAQFLSYEIDHYFGLLCAAFVL